MILDRIARFLFRDSDTAFSGRNRTRIILGTDRKKEKDTGYGDGGQNDAESGTIDIVAGHTNEQNCDYLNDKSRIYISGKTDADSYFNINQGTASEEEAAIVNHSDNIYLKARKQIKILNDNLSVVIDSDGNITIKTNQKIEMSSGTNKIVISSNGIELDAGQGINGKILTDADILQGTLQGTTPVGGGTVTFALLPFAVNQKVTVK